MLFKLSILSALVLVASETHITGCLDENKYCVGRPIDCIDTEDECIVTFSSVSNGTHTEIEIFSAFLYDKTWLAAVYSAENQMSDDFVVFCIRDDMHFRRMDEKGGLAYNEFNESKMIGTVKDMKEKKNDKYGFELEMVDHGTGGGTLYCKMTHRVEPIVEHFNTTKVNIMMARGAWINDSLSYDGLRTLYLGIVDLSGEKKAKKPVSSPLAPFSAAVTYLTEILF